VSKPTKEELEARAQWKADTEESIKSGKVAEFIVRSTGTKSFIESLFLKHGIPTETVKVSGGYKIIKKSNICPTCKGKGYLHS